MSNWVLCFKKKRYRVVYDAKSSLMVSWLPAAQHTFFSATTCLRLCSLGTNVRECQKVWMYSECCDHLHPQNASMPINRQNRALSVNMFFCENRHVSQSQVIAREVCFSGFLASQSVSQLKKPPRIEGPSQLAGRCRGTTWVSNSLIIISRKRRQHDLPTFDASGTISLSTTLFLLFCAKS